MNGIDFRLEREKKENQKNCEFRRELDGYCDIDRDHVLNKCPDKCPLDNWDETAFNFVFNKIELNYNYLLPEQQPKLKKMLLKLFKLNMR